MHQNTAFCGLNCLDCEAYQATQANDTAWQERILEKWRVEFNSPDMPIAAISCDGCKTAGGRAGGYCSECMLRACGLEKGVETCAHCAEYDTCEKLAGFFNFAPNIKVTLDAIRATL